MWDDVWEKIFSAKEWGKYPAESVIRFTARNFYSVDDRSSVKILDLGCGTGTIAWYLSREGFSAHGIDASPTAIDIAKNRFQSEGLEGHFKLGDFLNLPYEDDVFDAVIDGYAMATNGRESHAKVLSEVSRILRPGGMLYSIFPDVSCYGYGTGKKIDKYLFHNVECGPFTGQGTLYFFDREEVEKQFSDFSIVELEKETRTINNGKEQVVSWVLYAQKKN